MWAVKLCTNKILQFLAAGGDGYMQVDLYNGRKMVVIVLMSKGFKRHFGLVGVCANNFVNLPVFLFTYLFQAARPIYRTVQQRPFNGL